MRKLISLIAVIAIVVAAVVFLPELVHKCDDCEEVFVGVGYEPNIVGDLLTDDQIICKACAEKQHALSIALGKSVEDFKRELFE